MFKYIFQGFLLGIAYVAPIGMQNLYVINTAARMDRSRAYKVAFITIFFDITLALACFFGVGVLLKSLPMLRGLFQVLGSIAVIVIGFNLVRATPNIDKEVKINEPVIKIISICFAVTWLNPQAIIDGSLILGGIRATLSENFSLYFILGVALASFIWFTGLTTVISIFKSKINISFIRYINIICGVVIIIYGIKIGYSFLKAL